MDQPQIQQLPPTRLLSIPQHSRVQFTETHPHQQHIYFDSKFDSGNLSKVVRNSYDHYSVWTASDAQGTENPGYPKSWFYFRVGGFRNRKVMFSIFRVHFLWAMINRSHLYRPVFRTISTKQSCSQQKLDSQSDQKVYSEWKRLTEPINSLKVNDQEELVLKFGFYFGSQVESVEFAFIYPYNHEQCHQDMVKLDEQYSDNPEIFFKRYELCRSYEARCVDMALISSHQGKEGYENIKTDNTFTLGDKKLVKFRNNKPIIFISARVHPIQTPSSFTMTGIIKFLLNAQDYRAHLLRKYFVFVVVPMLNPDGVSNGHCRMDSLNQNLNRYYNSPDPIKQPSCYSVMKLCEYYNKDERLFMYLDLHAHPAYKGNFIFGNAIFDFIEQVESHLFPKVLSQNCVSFEFEQCNFSRKHMKAKDRNQDMNKQGCGRVVFYKEFGLTHSYTLECGYHCNTYNNILTGQQNDKHIYVARYKRNQKGEYIYDSFEQSIAEQSQDNIRNYLMSLHAKRSSGSVFYKAFQNVKDQLDNNDSERYQGQPALFQQETFYNLGKNICVSILDIWSKNPYSRIPNINEQRKEIAERQAKLDRFRKEQVGIRTKQKKIVELIQTQFYAEWHRKNIFQVQTVSGNFQKNQKKHVSDFKRVEKSLTITEAREEILSSTSVNKLIITHKRKMLGKEEKKIGTIQPSLESIKLISGSDIIKGPALFKTVIDAKRFFKPFNMRIKNLHLGNK